MVKWRVWLKRFMKKISFIDGETKKYYKRILHDHPVLAKIMMTEFQLDNKSIRIEKITNELYGINILVNDRGKLITVTIELLNKEIIIKDRSLSYQTIYDDNLNCVIPKYYEYCNNQRKILRKINVPIKPVYQSVYALILKENDKSYNITLVGGEKNFDISVLIQNLLTYVKDINNIRDLLITISNLLDLSYFVIKLSDNNGSLIRIDNGNLMDYLEYRDANDEKQKIILKNNEFIMERRIKEKCCEEVSYIKKLGVYHGKEKRKD